MLPRFLPDDWKGWFVLLVLVFVLSSFLDNIAAAMIGGAIAHTVFRGKVHIGYLAAIVAASNAGGAGSVVGDTTTTMMWIAGISPLEVLEAFIAAAVAPRDLRHPGVAASSSASRRSRSTMASTPAIDWARVGVVAFILVVGDGRERRSSTLRFNAVSRTCFPFLGAAVWVAMLLIGARCACPNGVCCPARSRARCSCSRS